MLYATQYQDCNHKASSHEDLTTSPHGPTNAQCSECNFCIRHKPIHDRPRCTAVSSYSHQQRRSPSSKPSHLSLSWSVECKGEVSCRFLGFNICTLLLSPFLGAGAFRKWIPIGLLQMHTAALAGQGVHIGRCSCWRTDRACRGRWAVPHCSSANPRLPRSRCLPQGRPTFWPVS